MRTVGWGVVGVLLTATCLQAGRAAGEEEGSVRQVFEDYKAALLAGDGEAAVALVDRETLTYYRELRRLAVEGSEEEILGRSFIERLIIVSMRHQLTPEVMADLELAEFIRLAVEQNWIQTQSIAQLEIGEITVSGVDAEGQAMTRAQKEGAAPTATNTGIETLRYRFVKEDGAWRFRFSSLVAGLDRLVSELAVQLGVEENDLIFTLVEAFSGRQVLPEVWQRPE